jgi:hypothetical protein
LNLNNFERHKNSKDHIERLEKTDRKLQILGGKNKTRDQWVRPIYCVGLAVAANDLCGI